VLRLAYGEWSQLPLRMSAAVAFFGSFALLLEPGSCLAILLEKRLTADDCRGNYD
jgi:hypothetical protein